MIFFAKPLLTEDLCRVKGDFAISAIRTLDEMPSIFIRDKPVFSSDKMLHKDYDRKGSVEKISGLELQGA
jgi:hypothetical protein